MTGGVSIPLRVIAINSIGEGTPSDKIDLIPSALPSAPASISVTTALLRKDYNDLVWTASTDTGIGDTSIDKNDCLGGSFVILLFSNFL